MLTLNFIFRIPKSEALWSLQRNTYGHKDFAYYLICVLKQKLNIKTPSQQIRFFTCYTCTNMYMSKRLHNDYK